MALPLTRALRYRSELLKNYIINGAMMVSQENGSSAGTTQNYFPVDQFNFDFVSSGGVSVAQIASPSPAGSPNRLRVTVTSADASVATTDYFQVVHQIEGLRVADLAYGTSSAKTTTLQFGVKAPAGTYCVVFTNSAANRCYVAEYVISAGEANTDRVKTVTVPGDVTGTWLKDNGNGLRIRWGLMAGSTYQQASGSWGTTNAIGSSNQFNFMGTNGNVFELFDVGLYQGATAPDFQVPDYASTLIECLRYYWKDATTAVCYIEGCAPSGGGALALPVRFPVVMRATPTVTTTWTVLNVNTPAIPIAGPGGFVAQAVISGSGGARLYMQNATPVVANARL